VGDITFFSRYQHKANIDRFEGYDKGYVLAGIKIEF